MTPVDYITIAAILAIGVLAYKVISHRVSKKNRLYVLIGVVIAVAIVWVHLAVVIVDTWPFAGS